MINNKVHDEAVRRLVDKFHPEKIILFGSQARGTADNRSDIDLLIISPIKEKRRELMVEMNRALTELECAFDIIILTRDEFERDRKIPGTIGRYETDKLTPYAVTARYPGVDEIVTENEALE